MNEPQRKPLTIRNMPPAEVPDITIMIVNKNGKYPPSLADKYTYTRLMCLYYRAVLEGRDTVEGPPGTPPCPLDVFEDNLHTLYRHFDRAKQDGVIVATTDGDDEERPQFIN